MNSFFLFSLNWNVVNRNSVFFDTNNGSRSSILRIYLYPQFKLVDSTIYLVSYRVSENHVQITTVEFQELNFTNKIRRHTSHFELTKKDYLSQRGLKKILGKRQ
uniref:Uncharacterized protein n=1 Tax=Solanum lycopersicum TaxID=4081 RepID=A0A3Q7FFM9_SOLLC